VILKVLVLSPTLFEFYSAFSIQPSLQLLIKLYFLAPVWRKLEDWSVIEESDDFAALMIKEQEVLK